MADSLGQNVSNVVTGPTLPAPGDKSWTEFEIDPSYRALPPSGRAAVRNRYFEEQVVPRYLKSQGLTAIPPDQAQVLRQHFNEITREAPLKYGNLSESILERDAGKLPNIDYVQGIPFGSLESFYSADNDRERYLALAKDYGKSNVGIDPGGRWYVRTPDKKLKAVIGFNTFKNLGAQLASDSPELVGMAVGSLAGPEVPAAMKSGALIARYGPKIGRFLTDQVGRLEALAPVGRTVQKVAEFGARNVVDRPIASVVRAAPTIAGAEFGAGAQELSKTALGTEAKTYPEFAKKAGVEAVNALVGDVMSRGLSAFGQKRLLDAYVRGSSAEEKAQAVRALGEGFRPSVAQARFETGGAKLWRYAQGLYDMVSSGREKRTAANNKIISEQLDEFLTRIGITNPEVAKDFKSRVLTKDFEIERAGTTVGKPIEDAKKKIADALDVALTKANADLEAETNRIMVESGSVAHPVLAQDLEKEIVGARSQLAKLANTKYETIWSMGGDEGINAPTAPLKQKARELWADILKTAEKQPTTETKLGLDSDVWQQITQEGRPPQAINTRLDAFKAQVARILDAPGQVPLQQLAGLRSDFYKVAEDNTLTPGVEKGRYRDLADSITTTFEDMAARPDLPGEAAKELQATNKWYADEIGKFEAANIVRLAREAGTVGAPRAEDIPANIIKPGYESLISDVRGVIGQDLWSKLAGTRFRELKDAALNRDTGKLDPGKLSTILGDYTKNGFARKVWGDKIGRDIETLQKEAAVLGDKIDPATLTPGTIRESIDKAVTAKRVFDKYWNENLMGELSAGGVRQEKALERVAGLNSLSEIRMLKAHFGETSPEFEHVQQMAMQKILTDAIKITPYPGAAQFMDEQMTKNLSAIGRDKLEAMFGRDLTEDLFALADRVRYVSYKGGNMLAGALRAGQLMFHPIAHLGAIVQNTIEGKLMKTPGFIRWITIGLEGDSRFTQMVSGMTKLAAFEADRELERIRNQITPPPSEYNQQEQR